MNPDHRGCSATSSSLEHGVVKNLIGRFELPDSSCQKLNTNNNRHNVKRLSSDTFLSLPSQTSANHRSWTPCESYQNCVEDSSTASLGVCTEDAIKCLSSSCDDLLSVTIPSSRPVPLPRRKRSQHLSCGRSPLNDIESQSELQTGKRVGSTPDLLAATETDQLKVCSDNVDGNKNYRRSCLSSVSDSAKNVSKVEEQLLSAFSSSVKPLVSKSKPPVLSPLKVFHRNKESLVSTASSEMQSSLDRNSCSSCGEPGRCMFILTEVKKAYILRHQKDIKLL